MFRRIGVEDWQTTLTIISFGIFFSVFLINLLRIARMPRKQLDRLEHLPISDEPNEHDTL